MEIWLIKWLNKFKKEISMGFTKNASTKQCETNATMSSSCQTNEKKRGKTRPHVVIHCNVGFNNNLFIRGSGANLSWDKGIMLQNTKPDEWVWETDLPFNSCEFKVLINDSHYEQGDNHILTSENSLEYTPCFSC
jgi:hypothetical protein